MNKFAELPLAEPMYSTYHNEVASAVLVQNPSIRNWYLNRIMNLVCDRRFLSGYTTPNIRIAGATLTKNPCIRRRYLYIPFLKGCMSRVIRNLIDNGYYIYFTGVDDYYIKGKTWYKERHFRHDGTICGYNQLDKTYCIYAYDGNWINQKFWVPQKCFSRGAEAIMQKGGSSYLCAFKPQLDAVVFSAGTALNRITKYLDSDMEKYPEDGEGDVYGIVVHAYIAKYVGKLFDGSIPYERMDRRVFRVIWEQKKVMLQRIKMIEDSLAMNNEISEKYKRLVAEADMMRMLYASHYMRRRDAVLPIIQKKLLTLMKNEKELLTMLVEKAGKEQNDESMEVSQE